VHDPAGQRYLVYTIEQNGGRSVAKAIPVEPGPLAGNDVVVLSGLTAGQRIVVMGANLLQPGDPVKEVEEDSMPHDSHWTATGFNVARYFVEHQHISWVLFAGVLAWGVGAYQAMPKRKDPDIPVRQV